MQAKLFNRLISRFAPPPLTWWRMSAAIAVAMIADGVQFFFGPFGWIFLDEIIDVLAMGLVTLLLGFHPLLLPTFVVELIPLADMLPSWTGCVIAVVALRKRAQYKMAFAPDGTKQKAPAEKIPSRMDSGI